MAEIQEEDVKRALRDGAEELKTIHDRIIALFDELTNTESMVRSLAVRSVDYSTDFNAGNGKSTKRDLSDLLKKYEQIKKQREFEIWNEIRRLTEDEEKINRIRVCYQTLRGKEYRYLQSLYVKGKPYKEVEIESGVSHRTFERTRKGGMKKILQLYASGLSNQEIIHVNKVKSRRRRNTQAKKQEYEQMHLDLK